MSRKLKLLVMLSVALNLLLLGMVAGHWLKPPSKGHRFIHHTLAQLADQLPPEKSRMVQEELQALREDKDNHRKQWRARGKALRQVMTAPQFDAEAYRAELEQLRQMRVGMMQDMEETLVRIVSRLSLEEREKLAELLRHRRGDKPKPTR